MNTNRRMAFIFSVVTAALIFMAAPTKSRAASDNKTFTTDFRIEDCTFSNRGKNAYFSLNPGDYLVLSDGTESVEITVLRNVRKIDFTTAKGEELSVNTRVIEEMETENGNLVELSRNFFARCAETNDIFYFGEDVFPADIGGAWLAGQDDALPGIIMPGTFLLGARYFQEIAPDVALDRAEHIKMGLTIKVDTIPEKTFRDCVEIIETSLLEPGAKSVKRYCPGVGLVFDNGLGLIDFYIANDNDD